jgi:hypothetical protein
MSRSTTRGIQCRCRIERVQSPRKQGPGRARRLVDDSRRGEWEEGEHPAFWQEAIARVLEPRQGAIRAIWDAGKREDADQLRPRLEALLTACAADLLAGLYPQARTILAAELAAAPAVIDETPRAAWPLFPG